MILRNLSFEVENVKVLLQSQSVLRYVTTWYGSYLKQFVCEFLCNETRYEYIRNKIIKQSVQDIFNH